MGQCFPASFNDPNGCSLKKVSFSSQKSLDLQDFKLEKLCHGLNKSNFKKVFA